MATGGVASALHGCRNHASLCHDFFTDLNASGLSSRVGNRLWYILLPSQHCALPYQLRLAIHAILLAPWKSYQIVHGSSRILVHPRLCKLQLKLPSSGVTMVSQCLNG